MKNAKSVRCITVIDLGRENKIMNVLEKILEEIERTRKSIIDMSDKEPEIIDAEELFDEGVDQGKLIAYEVVKEIIRSHMDEAKDTNAISNDKIIENDGIDSVSKEFLKDCAETAARYKRSDSNWIPVEERLPEETEYYLVQLSRRLPNEDYSDRVVVLFNGEEKEFMCYANLIIAWQTLPEQYRGDSNA